jgi:hypothetical protein
VCWETAFIYICNIQYNNDDDERLQDPILLLKIPMGTQKKNSRKVIDTLDTRSQKGWPALQIAYTLKRHWFRFPIRRTETNVSFLSGLFKHFLCSVFVAF